MENVSGIELGDFINDLELGRNRGHRRLAIVIEVEEKRFLVAYPFNPEEYEHSFYDFDHHIKWEKGDVGLAQECHDRYRLRIKSMGKHVRKFKVVHPALKPNKELFPA